MSFAADFNKWKNKTNLSFDKASRAVVLDCASRIGLRSPVRDGVYLANHKVKLGSIDPRADAINSTRDKNTVVSKAIAAGGKAGDIWYISNSLAYARRLEYGSWSAQAPGGIYRLAAMDTRNQISRIARESGL